MHISSLVPSPQTTGVVRLRVSNVQLMLKLLTLLNESGVSYHHAFCQ